MGFQRGRTGALVIGGYGFLDTGDDRRRSLYRLAETHVRFPRKSCAKTTIKAITCTTSHRTTSCVPINIGILDVIFTMEIELLALEVLVRQARLPAPLSCPAAPTATKTAPARTCRWSPPAGCGEPFPA
jgi:hypothetical protein